MDVKVQAVSGGAAANEDRSVFPARQEELAEKGGRSVLLARQEELTGNTGRNVFLARQEELTEKGGRSVLLARQEELMENTDRSVFLAWQEELTERMLHTHAYFEMICVLAGKCRHTIQGSNEELRAGDLCLVPPHTVHLASAETDSRIIYILVRQENMENVFYNILRDKNEISDFMLDSVYGKNDDSCRTFHTGTDGEINRQILEMYAEQQEHKDAGSDRIVASMLVIFLTRLMRQYQGTASIPEGRPADSGDTGFLRDIFRDYRTITLSELAGRLNYSVPYCSKYIKETTGQTFLQILHGVRFRKAEDFLCTSSFSVQKISSLIGYESPENFIRAFKKEYGVSPTQYRAAHT